MTSFSYIYVDTIRTTTSLINTINIYLCVYVIMRFFRHRHEPRQGLTNSCTTCGMEDEKYLLYPCVSFYAEPTSLDGYEPLQG